MSLTKEQILQADDLPRTELQIPEWGGDVFIKTMTSAERDAYEASIRDGRQEDGEVNLVNFRALFCVLVIVDEEGTRLFSDEEAPQLGKKGGPAVDRIFDFARKWNKLSDEDIEELEKNSETVQTDASASD